MAKTIKQASTEKKVSRHEFYFETPLYVIVPHSQLEENVLKGEVDGFSSVNKIDTTYSISTEYICRLDYNWDGTFRGYKAEDAFSDYKIAKLVCRRRGETLCFLIFDLGYDVGLMKIGQYPSLADMQFSELDKKYKNVLGKESMFLLKRAVGLAAHGTGAGSFVYLRRIFEGLIKESFDNHKNDLSIDKKEFSSKRMEDKIKILKEFLPKELNEMKPLYGILSQGVHELTEEECLKYFPVLKLSIELILDSKIEAAQKYKRAAEVKAQVSKISSEIGEKKK